MTVTCVKANVPRLCYALRVREFAYIGKGRGAVLVDGFWWTYHDGGEIRHKLVADDGTRGWRLSGRLSYALDLNVTQ